MVGISFWQNRIFISTMKTIFDRIVYLLIVVALSLVSLALVDFMLHPLAKDFTYNSTLYRAVTLLLLTPLTLLVWFPDYPRCLATLLARWLILWAGTVAFWRGAQGDWAGAVCALLDL